MLTTLSGKLRRMLKLMTSPNQTYYPHLERKNRFEIIGDQLTWILKNRELNEYYYTYGLDRKSKEVADHVIPYRTFRRIRDSRNLRPSGVNFNYSALLQDKFVFGQFLSSLHIPTPVNIALLGHTSVTWLNTMQVCPLSALAGDNIYVDGFCKKLTGMQGSGAFRLHVTGNSMYIGDRLSSIDDLSKKLDGSYLLQERLQQHQALDQLFPRALNTVRIVTFNNNGKTEVFNAVMRIGTGESNVDNWNSGGIAVGIDLDSGRLRTSGLFKPKYGRLVEVHPDTGVRFDQFVVPYFHESLELACKAHRYLYGVHSIGWDIAVGPQGPVIIEGNDDWDGSLAMAFEPDFKKKFMQMFSK